MSALVHPYMLVGLVLAGVPVLLHLILRPRPKILRFPAFRFLRQQHMSNRRRLRLQHLLLLLLRMAVIAGLCLALARPRLAGVPWAVGERPVIAVLLFDTSKSMDYGSVGGGPGRLDEAKTRARELLDEMAEDSRIIVLDSAEVLREDEPWISPRQARAKLDGRMQTHPASGALNRAVEQAFFRLERETKGEDPPPCFLYVFSDRTRACWDTAGARPRRPEGVSAVFVDVGSDTPKDLAVEALEVEPRVVSPGSKVEVRVTVRATGEDYNTVLSCRYDGEPDPNRALARRPLQLAAGQSQVVVFEYDAPTPPSEADEGAIQVTAEVGTDDNLPWDNKRYATFLIRQRRKVLTVVDRAAAAEDPPPYRGWEVALNVVGAFQCEVQKADEVAGMDEKTLAKYPVVCLFQVAPPAELWQKLTRYVHNGGGLAVVPGGREWAAVVEAVNRDGKELLPLTLRKITEIPANGRAILWSDFSPRYPLTAFFSNSLKTSDPDYGKAALRPRVYAYWQTDKADDGEVIASFADDKHGVALAVRRVGKGRVLQFTTPLDFSFLDRVRRWHNYWQASSFGVVLTDQVCRDLAGDYAVPEMNYLCGQDVRLALPHQAAFTLRGPDQEVKLAPRADGQLVLPADISPGNFVILAGADKVAWRSFNVRAEEADLERVPKEDLEAVLGQGSVVQVGRARSIKDALQGQRPPPVELLPYLMMAVLLFLAIEGLFANQFYRKANAEPEPERVAS
jgi:hypothetical protein